MQLDLTQLSLLDGPADPALDRLTRLARKILAADIALVSIIDPAKNRQFFASASGSEGALVQERETPLSHSFCKHVIARNAPLIIEDARKDKQLRSNPAVQDLGVIGYLGMPIFAPDGTGIGALCAIANQPRKWSEEDRSFLNDLAGSVTDQVLLRSTVLMEEEAQRSARHFGSIVENASHEVFAFDCETLKFINVNKGARENLGYSASALSAMTPLDIKPAFDLPAFRALIEPVASGATSVLEFVTRHRRKNGSEYPVSIRLERNQDWDRDVYIAFCEDITEKVNLETALRLETDSFRALFSHGPDPITVSDMDTRIQSANPASKRLFGTSAEALIGQKFVDFVPKDDQAVFATRLAACTPRQPFFSMLQKQMLNGRERMVLWTNITQFEGDKPFRLFSIGKDVSDLHAAMTLAEQREAEARKAMEVRKTFLANMSHEVRTPLNAIIGLFQLIQMTDEPDRQTELAQVGLNASYHMLGQLVNVLEMSRVDAKAVSIRSLPCDIRAMATQWHETALATHHRMNKAVEVTLSVDPNTPETWVFDPQRVTQIVNNLMDNALKFTAEGEVSLSVRPLIGQAALEIMVRDTGCGIPAQKRGALFDRFTQADTTMTRAQKGVGLGLAISLELSKLMGATLRLVPLDEGSRFVTAFSLVVPMAEVSTA